MSDIWETISGGALHSGSWGIGDFKLPDAGLTEAGAKKISNGKTTDLSQAVGGAIQAAAAPAATKTTSSTGFVSGLAPGAGAVGGGNGGGGGGGGGSYSGNPDTKYTTINGETKKDSDWMKEGKMSSSGAIIDNAAASQQDAAARAAEAKRQAAARKYQAQAQIAAGAKDSAKGQYDWLIDTLGTNKKDLLTEVATNEEQGLKNYAEQETKTKSQYDSARQEILTTYRDLTREQERLMRGSGQSQSSRSQEATIRLNNLLGKDMSAVSTNEADSLALIGNALTSFKTSTLQTKNRIETDTKQKLDKAALDYNDLIKSIDNNLMLSANEREDAYAAAEVALADDTAKINTWATGLKLQAQQTEAALKEQIDDYIISMTDANGLLNSDLGSKKSATNEILKGAGLTTMDTETDVTTNTSGGGTTKKTTYRTKEEIDNAIASGAITPLEGQQQIAMLQAPKSGAAAATLTASNANLLKTRGGNRMTTSVQNDPLLGALFA